MADQEYLVILEKGVEVWNQWRKEYPNVLPDLGDADLSYADLQSIDLREAKLSYANLSGSNLSCADLSWANLSYANLSYAFLIRANFHRADLSSIDVSDADLSDADLSDADLRSAHLERAHLNRANLSYTDLSNANLSDAVLCSVDLIGVHFSSTDLSSADLSDAKSGWTTFGNIDLRLVRGLDTVKHVGPSTIGIDTIYRSQGKIPEVFLRGAGILNPFIDYTRSLVSTPIDYFSCFISYSSQDEPFAKRLYADLQSNRVRCWFAPEDLKTGAKIRSSIDESIRLHDKLLLVLSEHSVASQWVEQEVETALEKERKEHRIALFPIRLDNTVMDIEGGWPALIRNTRNIGDFTRWKRHDAYQKAFERLLRDLKAQS